MQARGTRYAADLGVRPAPPKAEVVDAAQVWCEAYFANHEPESPVRSSLSKPPTDWRKRLYKKTFEILAWDWGKKIPDLMSELCAGRSLCDHR